MIDTNRAVGSHSADNFPSEYLFNSTKPVGHIRPMLLIYKLLCCYNHIVMIYTLELGSPIN